MKQIAIYTLTSELHDESAVAAVTHEFLANLHVDYELRGHDYADYGSHTLDLIYVRTGGTEGIFLRLLPQLQAQSNRPFYLLTSGKSNSLAASMEILSYLRQHGFKGEIIHGSSEYIHTRIGILTKVAEARKQLQGLRLGIIGQPSDWLISSLADKDKVHQLLGIELVDIPMQELLDAIADTPVKEQTADPSLTQKAVRRRLAWSHTDIQGTEDHRPSPPAARVHPALLRPAHRRPQHGLPGTWPGSTPKASWLAARAMSQPCSP